MSSAEPLTGEQAEAGLALGLRAAGPAGGSLAELSRRRAWLAEARFPATVYAISRLVLLGVALVVSLLTHHGLLAGFLRFDGHWYLRLARHGYPSQATGAQSTLGFFPLYPLAIRSVSALFFGLVSSAASLAGSALTVSLAGGLASALLLHRLVTTWWGEASARRAVLVFCLWPGSVVFSMAYSECLTIPLILGCMLALRAGRYLPAGLLAGLATSSEPTALALIPVCVVAAVRELRQCGWLSRIGRRSLAGALLSPLGIGAFAVFLWIWTGTPFASYRAQHYGWHQQNSPFGVLGAPVVQRLLHSPWSIIAHYITLNLWNGVLGGAFLVASLVLIYKARRDVPLEAKVWTAGIAALTIWSVMTPPNARMLLIAFPAVIIWTRRIPGRWLWLFVLPELALFVLMSGFTFAGRMLP